MGGEAAGGGGRGVWPQDLELLNQRAWKAVGAQPGTSEVGPTPKEMLRSSLVEPVFQRNVIPHCLFSAPQTPQLRKPRESHLKKNLASRAPSSFAGGRVPRLQLLPPHQQTPNHRNAVGSPGDRGRVAGQ